MPGDESWGLRLGRWDRSSVSPMAQAAGVSTSARDHADLCSPENLGVSYGK